MTKKQQHNFTVNQLDEKGRSKYAVFAPALSTFYSTFVSKQRFGEYTKTERIPAAFERGVEGLNWLNKDEGYFTYKWSLYSAGHADLDLTKVVPKEDMVRNRDRENTLMLGDSGGFQIAKGVWAGDWKANSGCPKAQKYRSSVLKWLDGIADYSMVLDIPTWVIHNKEASDAVCIKTYQEAVDATRFNNDYFMQHRLGVKNGGTKFLNVLQGSNHSEADLWYNTMKDYCDPKKYPDTHFDGWAMGGQNMCDVHLILRRIIELKHDGLLQEGVHDWMHFLGTSKLEWAILLTELQKLVREHINPQFTISFDCASPFLATANGQIYHHIDLPHRQKWSYRMSPSADDKKYSTDTRSLRDALLQDGVLPHFDESPISERLKINDVCVYHPNSLNKIGKETKTSWDSFSYVLQMGHNVWTHIHAVQEANRAYAAGEFPSMMQQNGYEYEMFHEILEKIFRCKTKKDALAMIDHYSSYWMQIVGTRGASGKKAKNAHTNFNKFFEVDETEEVEPPKDVTDVDLDTQMLETLDIESEKE